MTIVDDILHSIKKLFKIKDIGILFREQSMRRCIVFNKKGFSIIEIMVVASILGLLSLMLMPSYQEFKKNGHRQAARVHLSTYQRSAKMMIGEFGYNPGNFVALGFQPEGNIYYRIIAADSNRNPPDYYPNNDCCFSTGHDSNHTHTNCTGTNDCVDCGAGYRDAWQETLSNYSNKTATVNGRSFKVYAVSDKSDDFLCTNEADVFTGDCG